MQNLDGTVLDVMRRSSNNGILFLNQIANLAGVNTRMARNALSRLESRGSVKRAIKGTASAWSIAGPS